MSSPDIIASMTILAAVLVAGYKFFLAIPPGFPTKEFVAFRNTATGGTTTVTLSAWATLQSAFQKDQVYAKGYVIS
jgi:kynureninase